MKRILLRLITFIIFSANIQVQAMEQEQDQVAQPSSRDFFMQGELYVHQGNWPDASACFEQAIVLDKEGENTSSFFARSHLANKAYKDGDHVKALWHYEKMFDSKYSRYFSARNRLNLSCLWRHADDPISESISGVLLYQAAQAHAFVVDNVQAKFEAWAEIAHRYYYGIGVSSNKNVAMEVAKEVFGKHAIFSQRPEGQAHFVRMGVDNDRARSRVCYLMGLIHRDNGNYADAKKKFKHLLKYANPDSSFVVRSHYELGWMHVDGLACKKSKVKALRHFNKIIEQPEVDPVLTVRAMNIIKEIEQSQPPQKKQKLTGD